MHPQQLEALHGGRRRYKIWSASLILGVALTAALAYATTDEDCRRALLEPRPGFFSRIATGTTDYLRHQVNLQNAVNHADRDLFTALVNDGVIARGSIRRGDDVESTTPSVRALPVLHVQGREYVPLRVQRRGDTVTATATTEPTIEADIITGGRSYHVSLVANSARVREFLTANHITVSTGMMLGAGPYREAQVPAGSAAANALPYSTLSSSQNTFGDLIMMLAREKGIGQDVLDRIDLRSLSLASIQAGSFDMGSPTDETDRDSRDENQHHVQLTKDFEMQATSVTQFVWFVVMGGNPSHFKEKKHAENDFAKVSGTQLLLNHPVEQVSYEDVKEFMKKLNELTKRHNPSFEGEFSLPTEAQWEYAARGGTTTRYHFDESRDALRDFAWYSENADGHTHAVGTRQPNPLGLFDMSGNVWQWVKDWYAAAYTMGVLTDPQGPSSGSYRVLRGGGWYGYARYVRSARRHYGHPGYRGNNVGFRFVRTLP